MRDYTSNQYCDYLWINDLLSLEKNENNEFKAVLKRSDAEKVSSISKVTIFGTIVEVRQIGERGILYSVDDGTGIITCKYNEMSFCPVFDLIQSERGTILNETFSNQSVNDSSQFDNSPSADDTIFNDLSLQEEEAIAEKRNRLKALHSIWTDIEDSLSGMIGVLQIGDIAFIQGKLYNYFNTNQIHVDLIRLMDRKEELILTVVKLEDGYKPCVQPSEMIHLPQSIQLIENSRKSGVMTFDHIHHLDTNELPASKIIVTNESCAECDGKRKRKSIFIPNLQGSMTFDTMNNLNDSSPVSKIPRLDNA